MNPLQVALAHLFFNITGVLLWYPIPHLRRVPIFLARRLGKAVRVTRLFGPLYIIFVFFLFPLLVMAISELFSNGKVAAGAVTITILCLLVIIMTYWCYYKGGAARVANSIENIRLKYMYSRGTDVAPSHATDEGDEASEEDPERARLRI